MSDSENKRGNKMAMGRRDFLRASAGAGAGTLLAAGAVGAAFEGSLLEAQGPSPAAPSRAQGGTASKGIPFWEAEPGKGGVGKPVAIDLHAHWTPAAYSKAIGEIGQPVNNPFVLDWDMDKRVRYMDEHGIEMHVLTLSGQKPWQRTTATQGARLAQIVNDAGIEAHMQHPTRLTAAAELPIRDAQMALAELNRVAGKPGIRAVGMPDSIERHDYLFDASFTPVLARIEELGYPIIFHQLDGVANNYGGDRVAGPPNLAAGIDAPTDHTVLATRFIMSGTLDKFPKLEVVLPHAGGSFPYLAGRIEHFLFHMNGQQAKLERPFREYIRRFHYDYLIYYPEAFRFLMTMVGTDRIVVGTDSFAAKDIVYPNNVLDQFGLPAAERERILRGNAARLLKL